MRHNTPITVALVIGILASAFISSFIMRSYPIKYGYYLNEFDPYFNYRATKYIVDNGIEEYWNWIDKKSWYPEGRNVAQSSQSFLHISTAFLYTPFQNNISLLDFTIILPVIWGSLTCIVIFALVRVLWGTSAGLIASLLVAFSPPLILRGNLGWFKSEPLGLLLSLSALFLLMHAVRYKHPKLRAISLGVLSGVTLALANASWGGSQYFSIPISVLFVALPFIRKNDTAYLTLLAIIFTASTLLTTLAFQRPGAAFVFGLPGIALIAGTVFLINAHFVKQLLPRLSPVKATSIILLIFAGSVIGLIGSGAYHVPDFRYLSAVNPFTTPRLSLTQGVAEHTVPTLADFFISYSVLLMLAGLGVLFSFQRRNDMSIFILILGITAVYVSGSMLRLMVFSSISIIILSSIGLSRLFIIREKRIVDNNQVQEKGDTKIADLNSHKQEAAHSKHLSSSSLSSSLYLNVGLVVLILVPLAIIPGENWLEQADVMPIIVSGAGNDLPSDTWIEATDWISQNTEEDAVIAAWWDYGYWITTLGNRTTIADNAAFYPDRIAKIGQMLMTEPEVGVKIAHELQADYILIHIVAQKIEPTDYNGAKNLYVLGFSGDENKVYWFATNGGLDPQIYLESDQFTLTPEFWNSTLMGALIPFEQQGYVVIDEKGDVSTILDEYQNNAVAVYSKLELPVDKGAPVHLSYVSQSLTNSPPEESSLSAVLLYQLEDN